MHARLKLLGTAMLVCLAVGLLVFFAVQTVRAVQRFQQNHPLALSGDVRTIRPWMTIPYIARVYRIPERDLLQALDISDPRSVRHVTLYVLAERVHRTPNALIHEIQTAILTYRQQHPSPSPSGVPHSAIPPPLVERKTA